MLSVNLFDDKGKKSGSVEIPADIFGARTNQHLLYLAVREYLDNQRQGTACTQNAADVRGGGKKPFKQKGTGRARQGSIRSSLMVGGYVAHGPEPRDHSWELPKKSRKAALKSALSDSYKSGKLGVIENIKVSGKTKDISELLKTMELTGHKVLLLDVVHSSETRKSGRNIPGLVLKPVREANPYDIIRADKVIITKKGLEAVKEAFAK
jgi:large subunit ribosomal protein L4